VKIRILFTPPYLGTRLISKMLAIVLSVFVFERAAAQTVSISGANELLSTYIGGGPNQFPAGFIANGYTVNVNNPPGVTTTLTIDVPIFTFVSCTFNMAPGTSIVVPINCQMRLDGGTLQASGQQLWHRILVQRGGQLTVANGTVVRDAQFGTEIEESAFIQLENAVYRDNWIGVYMPESQGNLKPFNVVEFNGNIFEQRNPLLTPFPGAGSVVLLPGAVANVPGPLSYAGILVWDGNGGFRPNINTPTANWVPNSFEGLLNGIVLNNATSYIENCRFSDILRPVPAPSYGTANLNYGFAVRSVAQGNNTINLDFIGLGQNAAQATIANCHTGIMGRGLDRFFVTESIIETATLPAFSIPEMGNGIVFQSMVLPKIVIRDNDITARRRGIFGSSINASQGGQIRIQGCAVNVNPTPGWSFNADGIRLANCAGISTAANNAYVWDCRPVVVNGGQRGISVTGNSQFINLIGNLVELDNINNTISQRGIYIENSADIAMACNEVHGDHIATNFNNPDAGIWCENTRFTAQCNTTDNITRGMYIGLALTGTDLLANDFGEHREGYHVASGGTGVQTDRGNRWNGSNYTPFGAFAGNMFTAFSSRFETPTNQPFTPLLFNESSFFSLSMNTPATCPYSCPILPPANQQGATGVEYQIALGTLAQPFFEPSVNWVLDRNLYERILAHPGMAPTGGILDAFRQQTEQSNLGELHEIERAAKENGHCPASLLAQKDALLEEARQLMDIQRAEYGELMNASDGVRTVLLAEILMRADALADLYRQLALLPLPSAADLAAEAELLFAHNAAISPTELWEENEKQFNSVYLETAAKRHYEFSEEQADLLESLIYQCPIAGGPAVYKARQLYEHIAIVDYDDETACQLAGIQYRQRRPEAQAVAAFDLAPSVAVFEFGVNRTDASAEAQIVVFNLAGQAVGMGAMPAGQTAVVFSCAHLPTGVYAVQMTVGGQPVGTQKLAIVRP
jgi:hypothetical protein